MKDYRPMAIAPRADHRLAGAALCVVLVCSFCVSSCVVGLEHTSDARLTDNFFRHETEFNSLLNRVRSDARLTTIQPTIIIYGGQRMEVSQNNVSDVRRVGLTEDGWLSYQSALRNLGLSGGVLKGDNAIEFRADQGSVFNGDSYKGYWYAPAPPGRALPSLDSYRTSANDRKDSFGGWIVCKRLKGNWYLYLFVSG